MRCARSRKIGLGSGAPGATHLRRRESAAGDNSPLEPIRRLSRALEKVQEEVISGSQQLPADRDICANCAISNGILLRIPRMEV